MGFSFDFAKWRLGVVAGLQWRLMTRIGRNQSRSPSYSLKALLARITPDNLHKEIDWGRPEGAETP